MSQVYGNRNQTLWRYGPMDWYRTVGLEVQVTWGSVRMFELEIDDLRFFRAQTCWLEGTLDDMRERRRSVLALARGIISQRDMPDNELNDIWPLLSVESCSPRLANSICQAYIDPPIRTFSDKDDMNSGFDDFYSQLNVNEALNSAYRAALFTNTVIVYWDGEQFLTLTPEYFRIVGKDIWIVRRDDKEQIVFDVWREKSHEVRNNVGAILSIEDNPWGMFPGVVIKLTPSNDTYGAGITEAAEINTWSSLLRLFSTRVSVFQGYSIGVGINSQLKEGDRLGPGKFVQLQNLSGEPANVPDLKFISPDGKFEEIENYRRNAISSFQRNQDLPGFLVDEGAGTPPTGAALQVLERALNDRRKQHLTSLKKSERQLARFIQKLAVSFDRATLVADKFDIKYKEPDTFTEPGKELEFDLQLANSGLVSPSAMTQKYLGTEKGQSDEDASDIMQKNKLLFSFLAPPTPIPEQKLA